MDVTKTVKKPAIGLIVVAVCNVLIWLRLFERLITPRGEWTTAEFTTDWVNVLFLNIPAAVQVETLTSAPVLLCLKIGILINLIIFYGAAHMMAGKRYYLSFSCSVLAMIPLLSPLFFLGIPVGIWSLRTLTRQDVRAGMIRNKMNT